VSGAGVAPIDPGRAVCYHRLFAAPMQIRRVPVLSFVPTGARGAAGVRCGISPMTFTIIVATYNRPDALRTAVRSALRQTFADWRMLVIGDGCDARTAETLQALGDARVAYVNLPARFGEQAGPNSIGMALADTEWIALLNHDDVWLPDHLERARAALAGSADLYIGRAARAEERRETETGVEPVFSKVSPLGRRLRHAFCDEENSFEPCSAWAFRSTLVRTVGPWRLARRIHRTPAEDWLLRAWRQGVRTVFDREITVLHVITHYRKAHPEGCYAAASPEHAALEALLARVPVEEFRAAVEATARTRDRSVLSHALRKPLRALLVNSLTAGLYRLTGLDANTLACVLAGKPRGRMLNRAALRRTGRELPAPPDFDEALACARRLCGKGGA
jgi:GT2 family glycosyltransferase